MSLATSSASFDGLSVGVDLVVGLLDLLLGLGLEGEHGAAKSGDNVGKVLLGLGLLGSDGLAEASAGLGRGGSSGVLGGVDLGEARGLLGDLLVEHGLGLLGHGADGGGELAAHLGAGLLGVEAKVLDLVVGLLGELGDLSGDLGVERGLGSLVLGLEGGLDTVHALLANLDGLGEGRLELLLVGLLELGDLATLEGVVLAVLLDNTGQLEDLALELLLVLDDGVGELGKTGREVGLGST